MATCKNCHLDLALALLNKYADNDCNNTLQVIIILYIFVTVAGDVMLTTTKLIDDLKVFFFTTNVNIAVIKRYCLILLSFQGDLNWAQS